MILAAVIGALISADSIEGVMPISFSCFHPRQLNQRGSMLFLSLFLCRINSSSINSTTVAGDLKWASVKDIPEGSINDQFFKLFYHSFSLMLLVL